MQIEEIREKVTPILNQKAIKRAGIFGSAARGEAVQKDVDMLVDMPRPYGLFAFLGLKYELENVLGVKVDLVDYINIKPSIRDSILRDEVRIL